MQFVKEPFAFLFCTLKHTVYVPGCVYEWVGFISLDAVPSPKVHRTESVLANGFDVFTK